MPKVESRRLSRRETVKFTGTGCSIKRKRETEDVEIDEPKWRPSTMQTNEERDAEGSPTMKRVRERWKEFESEPTIRRCLLG